MTMSMRSANIGQLIELGRLNIVKSTFSSDAAKAWNRAPDNIKQCTTLLSAKKENKTCVKFLPV